jgi:hypothetical protein
MNHQSAFRGAARRNLHRNHALGHKRRNVACQNRNLAFETEEGAIYRRPMFRCQLPRLIAFGIKCALNKMSDEPIVSSQIPVVSGEPACH